MCLFVFWKPFFQYPPVPLQRHHISSLQIKTRIIPMYQSTIHLVFILEFNKPLSFHFCSGAMIQLIAAILIHYKCKFWKFLCQNVNSVNIKCLTYKWIDRAIIISTLQCPIQFNGHDPVHCSFIEAYIVKILKVSLFKMEMWWTF